MSVSVGVTVSVSVSKILSFAHPFLEKKVEEISEGAVLKALALEGLDPISERKRGNLQESAE